MRWWELLVWLACVVILGGASWVGARGFRLGVAAKMCCSSNEEAAQTTASEVDASVYVPIMKWTHPHHLFGVYFLNSRNRSRRLNASVNACVIASVNASVNACVNGSRPRRLNASVNASVKGSRPRRLNAYVSCRFLSMHHPMMLHSSAAHHHFASH